MDAKLATNTRALFDNIPANSRLRKPLVAYLCAGMAPREIEKLNLAGVAPLLGRRYGASKAARNSLQEVLVAARHGTKRPRKEKEKELAADWIVNKTGRTESGRTRVVKNTPLSRVALYKEYKAEVVQPISKMLFASICSQHHVHFRIHEVDSMTCVVCRRLRANIRRLELLLEHGGTQRQIARRETELQKLRSKQSEHVTVVRAQRQCYLQDCAEVQSSSTLAIFILDYSTFPLMDRQTTKVLCVTVLRHGTNGLQRHYYDFVGLPLQGRWRDGLMYALTYLRGARQIDDISEAIIWTDAGSGDFRNAPVLFTFANLPQLVPHIWWRSMNFFAPRHGWNDCDRHFGAAKRSIGAWMDNCASRDPDAFLDAKTCAALIARLPHTTAYHVKRNARIVGAISSSIRGLTTHCCFRPNGDNRAILALPLSNSTEATEYFFQDARFVEHEVAAQCAQDRNP